MSDDDDHDHARLDFDKHGPHDEHTHYIGPIEPAKLPIYLHHDPPARRVFALYGDWYAVHTH